MYFFHFDLKFQYVYISTRKRKYPFFTRQLKIPICLYFYSCNNPFCDMIHRLKIPICLYFYHTTISGNINCSQNLKFQYVYISTCSVCSSEYSGLCLKFQYVYISTPIIFSLCFCLVIYDCFVYLPYFSFFVRKKY